MSSNTETGWIKFEYDLYIYYHTQYTIWLKGTLGSKSGSIKETTDYCVKPFHTIIIKGLHVCIFIPYQGYTQSYYSRH